MPRLWPILAVFILMALPFAIVGTPLIPNLNSLCHAHQADLNIALLFGISSNNKDGEICGTKPSSLTKMAYVESFKYVGKLINARDDLLPNISLGYTIMDTCNYDLAALAQTLYLTPDPNDTNVLAPEGKQNCTGETRRRFAVDGIVGPTSSREAVMIGGLTSLFRLPTILTWASSDELSDKTRFKYVMRMVPPDRYQADAILDFLLELGWTYVSLLYSEGAYGENGARQIERRTKSRGICISYSYMFASDFKEEDVGEVVKALVKFKKARAVIFFAYSSEARVLFKAIEKSEIAGHFIWVGSDGYGARSSDHAEAHGSFRIGFESRGDKDFLDYFNQLTPTDTPDNPWFRDYWQKVYDCLWDVPSVSNLSCQSVDVKLVPEAQGVKPDKVMDGLVVFALALHSVIEEYCPWVFNNKTDLKNCVKGERLLPILLNITFDGYNGRIKFDQNGDFIGQYVITQYMRDADIYLPVAKWDKATEKIETNHSSFQWSMYRNHNESILSGTPESVCSKPCEDTEYFIQKELSCCWECRHCRNNEIIVNNKTGCEVCPEFQWPDDTYLMCVDIKPEVIQWTSPLCLTLVTFVSLGIGVCFVAAGVFIKNNNMRLIKASSRQLMAIILSGILTAYVTVFFLLAKPSTVSCYVSRFGFNLAVSLIYAPLMVKTNRIYRIFTAGKKGNKRPGLIGTRPQLLLVTFFILLEVSLIIVSVSIAPPEPTLRMQVPTEKSVELFCDLPLQGLLPPLALNLIFLLVCALYGFLTRKLPANFNESWYIFVSVATTSFLWLVFLPAYFTAFYAVHQVTLLASCLTINALVTLLCLYVPKIYAIYFIDEENLQFQAAGTIGTMSTTPETQST